MYNIAMNRLIIALSLAVVFVFLQTPLVSASSDNFVIKSMDVRLELSRDTAKHSTLRTTETIIADFPSNQNRGITRSFVVGYDGHKTDLELESVKDEAGNNLRYHWEGKELRIGEEGVFVEGVRTYVISYTQRDVTRFFEDTGKDEFYWDAIGTDWRVPIEQASVSLRLHPSLVESKETDLQCYVGINNSNSKCDKSADDPMSFSFSNLSAGEGVTIAVGFKPGTFEQYKMTLFELFAMWWVRLQIFLTIVAVAFVIWMLIKSSKLTGRRGELGTIVPEYLPPSGVSVITSASLGGKAGVVSASSSRVVAQLLDLAVRHFIRLYEVKAKSFWSSAEYEVEVAKDLSGLLPEEKEIIEDMFGGPVTVGQRINLKNLKNNYAYYQRTVDDEGKLKSLLKNDYQLIDHPANYKIEFQGYAKVCLIAGLLLLSPVLAITAIVAFLISTSSVLTDKGLNLVRYLMGLKMYIGVAEVDRLAMLQSPEGAVKVGESADAKQLVRLYEKVLPYAVLFGQEKEWAKQLGGYYEQSGTEPNWYHGSGAFEASAFAASLNSLTSAASSISNYSSSSGGSSGGGSVGGGGGGGGGGGW